MVLGLHMTENAMNISDFDNPINHKIKDIYWLTPSDLIRHKTQIYVGESNLISDLGWFAQRTSKNTIYTGILILFIKN